MKVSSLILATLLSVNSLFALDMYSSRIDRELLRLNEVSEPYVYENSVIFTAPSSVQRLGVSFAHESYARIHWFKKLVRPQEYILIQNDPESIAVPAAGDSGLLFMVYQIPENFEQLEYRMIIDGLWTSDPWNSKRQWDTSKQIWVSLLSVPKRQTPQVAQSTLQSPIRFSFHGESGIPVFLAGTFNSWDPFMYQLTEHKPGEYTLELPLPPGTWQYAFIYKGEQVLDQENPIKVYTRDGRTASEISIHP
jgi:hypothetical protein